MIEKGPKKTEHPSAGQSPLMLCSMPPGEWFGYEQLMAFTLRVALVREVLPCLVAATASDTKLILHGSSELALHPNPHGWFPVNLNSDLDLILKQNRSDDEINPAAHIEALQKYAGNSGGQMCRDEAEGKVGVIFSREWSRDAATKILIDSLGTRGQHYADTVWHETASISASLPISFNSRELLLFSPKEETLPHISGPMPVQNKNDFLSGVWARIANDPKGHKLTDLSSTLNVLALWPHMVSDRVDEISRCALRLACLCKLAFSRDFEPVTTFVPTKAIDEIFERVEREETGRLFQSMTAANGGFHVYGRVWPAGFEGTAQCIFGRKPYSRNEEPEVLRSNLPLSAYLTDGERIFFDDIVGADSSRRPALRLSALEKDYGEIFRRYPELKENIRELLSELVFQSWVKRL